MAGYNVCFDWTVENLKLEAYSEIDYNTGNQCTKYQLSSKVVKSIVFPNKLGTEHKEGFWFMKLVVRSTDIVALVLSLTQGEISNYYSSEFDIALYCRNKLKWVSCSGKNLFHITHNQEYSFNTFATQSLLKHLVGRPPIKISCRLRVKVEKCIINAVPKEIPDFEKLLNDPEFSDFIIATSEKEFNVHKNILAARSEVFAAMIKTDMREKKEGFVRITDFNDEVIKELLRYIYCGRVQNLSKLSDELLLAADKYSIDGLKSMCLEEISKKLNVENALELLSLVDYHKVDYLKVNILNFVVINIKKFDQSKFGALAKSNLPNEILLKMKNLMI